ncbi:MAG: methyltransferase, FxLD system [Chloroflexi bacterium]|nr:methyltransferase, FxLD system [Chloroflexota bacterium]
MADRHDSLAVLHQMLVDDLKRKGFIRTPRVEQAFRAVPRHLFLPGVDRQIVYRDDAIPTKRLKSGEPISSSSQPAIMAIMLEQLALEPGQRVLEIGAGTGYNAALMTYLVGETGRVVALDIDDDIVDAARAHLQAAGFRQTQVVCADGGFGYPPAAPYDRIILTASAWDIAPAWREQLKLGGRLVLPLSLVGLGLLQQSVAFDHLGSHLASVSVKVCGFMPLRGAAAAQQPVVTLGAEPGLAIMTTHGHDLDAAAAYHWLTGPAHDQPTGLEVTTHELWLGLVFWLALRERDCCTVMASGEWLKRNAAPDPPELFSWPEQGRSTNGLVGADNGCALLMRPAPVADLTKDEQPFPLHVRCFGPAEQAAARLIEQSLAWHKAGRPMVESLRLQAYPWREAVEPPSGAQVVRKPATQLIVEWPEPS